MSIWSKIKERIGNWATGGEYAEKLEELKQWKATAMALEDRLDYYFRAQVDSISNKTEEVFGSAKVAVEGFAEDAKEAAEDLAEEVEEKAKDEVVSIRAKTQDVLADARGKRTQLLEDIHYGKLEHAIEEGVEKVKSIVKVKK